MINSLQSNQPKSRTGILSHFDRSSRIRRPLIISLPITTPSLPSDREMFSVPALRIPLSRGKTSQANEELHDLDTLPPVQAPSYVTSGKQSSRQATPPNNLSVSINRHFYSASSASSSEASSSSSNDFSCSCQAFSSTCSLVSPISKLKRQNRRHAGHFSKISISHDDHVEERYVYASPSGSSESSGEEVHSPSSLVRLNMGRKDLIAELSLPHHLPGSRQASFCESTAGLGEEKRLPVISPHTTSGWLLSTPPNEMKGNLVDCKDPDEEDLEDDEEEDVYKDEDKDWYERPSSSMSTRSDPFEYSSYLSISGAREGSGLDEDRPSDSSLSRASSITIRAVKSHAPVLRKVKGQHPTIHCRLSNTLAQVQSTPGSTVLDPRDSVFAALKALKDIHDGDSSIFMDDVDERDIIHNRFGQSHPSSRESLAIMPTTVSHRPRTYTPFKRTVAPVGSGSR